MEFGGFQRLTLLDYPGKVACTLFTRGCNFRCPFCHNASLVEGGGERISDESVLSYLKKRQGILEGVCISGGEPLLHAELAEFIRKVRELGYCVKLDTNGYFPDRLAELIGEGLVDHVAMDIKSSLERYPAVSGVADLDLSRIERSIDMLMSSGISYEFRTTVALGLHTADDIREAARRIAGADKYFLQNFVDSGDVLEAGFSSLNDAQMLEMLGAAREHVKNAQIRGKT